MNQPKWLTWRGRDSMHGVHRQVKRQAFKRVVPSKGVSLSLGHTDM